jgi:trans-2,3-dihydro-3-hydroxyanthranilate isomerase
MPHGDGLRIHWVDVFTDRPFAGNQLAVVLDADELDGEGMQAVTRELALSETVFVLDGSQRLRIFTPGKELPLAGHPTVGAALELARLGRIPAEGRTVFRTGVGDTPVDLSEGVATMTQADPELGPEGDPVAAAARLGLEAGDVAGAPAICSTGVPFEFVELRDRATLARARPDLHAIAELDEPEGVVAWAEDGDGAVAQRMFGPKFDIPEDPATGIAAGALGALRVFRGAEPGPLTVTQGAEIGRPSTIQVDVPGSAGSPEAPRVGGRAVPILEATLRRDALRGLL